MAHKNYSKFSDRFKKSEGEKVVEEIKEKIDNEVENEMFTEIINDENVTTMDTSIETPSDIIEKGHVVNCDKLNIREGNSINAKVLCVLNKGEEVEVNLTIIMENWYKVCTAAGVEGYCMAKYISLK